MKNKKQIAQKGFTQHLFPINRRWDSDTIASSSPNKKGAGFTLIEILVVVAIIALLSSVILISVMSARQKGRDAKRLSDMTQMNTALELYFAAYKGYPSSTGGIPQSMVPTYISSLPSVAMPADGVCNTGHSSDTCTTADSACAGIPQNQYYYIASGTAYTAVSGVQVYPDYVYFFCLGDKTGNFSAGPRVLNPKGVR